MRVFLVLLLLISASDSVLGIQREQRGDGNVVSGPQVYNNLKVNNQMRMKGEAGDVRSHYQSKIGTMDSSALISRAGGAARQDGTSGVPEVHSYNSLRTSEIIYNGTQVLTLIFFISVIIFGLFILIIALIPKYARKLGFRSRREALMEQEGSSPAPHEVDRKVSVGREKREASASNGPPLLFTKVKNHSLRRHSMVSDGSSDGCRVATRPRSSSSLPSVQTFSEMVDESTTGDEGSTRTSKHSASKSLKKRPCNNDLAGRICRTGGQEQARSSNGDYGGVQREPERSELSPTSASAVVAIQMSELIARWNPKKDSRLIQKANPMANERHFNAS